MRPLCYSDSDAVLLCFDISRPDTVDSSLKKVMASVLHFTVIVFFCTPLSHIYITYLILAIPSDIACFLKSIPYDCTIYIFADYYLLYLLLAFCVHSGKLRSWTSVRAHESCSLAVRPICAQMSAR